METKARIQEYVGEHRWELALHTITATALGHRVLHGATPAVHQAVLAAFEV